MADVEIKVAADAKQADDSIRGIKSQLKGLREEQARLPEGSAAWKKLGQQINETEGKLDSLNKRFETLRGSGVERLESSFGVLRQGLAGADWDKTKIGLQGIGSAMKAIPVLLITQGIIKLIENFDKLKNSGGLIGKVFTAIGDAVTFVIDKFTELTDWIGITNSSLDKMGDALKTNADKATEALALQNAEYDRQMKVAQASGKSGVEIERAKQRAIIETNKALIEQTLAYMNAGGKLTEEQTKLLSSQIEAVKNATATIKALRIKAEVEANAEAEKDYKKYLENIKKLREDAQKAILDGEAQERANLLRINQEFAKEDKALKDQALADQMARDDEELEKWKKRKKEEADYEAQQIKEAEEREKLSAQRKAQIQQNYFMAAASLADAFFSMELANAEGNEDAMNRVRERQFNVEKALKATQATIDGIAAVQKTLAQGGVLAVPLAISMGVMATANVLSILSKKFTASSKGGATSSPRITPSAQMANVSPSQEAITPTEGTAIRPDNKVYVSAKEIRDVNEDNRRVEIQSRF